MTEEQKLKPCPFCGFDKLHYYGYQDENMVWVIRCHCCNLTLKNHNKEILKEIWNMRKKRRVENETNNNV